MALFFLMWKHPSGHCEQCDVRESVEHVLLQCKKNGTERSFVTGLQRLGKVANSVKNAIEAAENAKGRKLLIAFLKDTR